MGNPRAGGTLPNARFPGRALAAVPAITPGNSPVGILWSRNPPEVAADLANSALLGLLA